MYELQVESRFNAVHRLPLPTGEWEPIHGHDWLVTVVIRGSQLDNGGMLVDFHELEQGLNAITDRLHHTDLNENAFVSHQPPSAEHVARVIYDGLRASIGGDALLHAVCVTEAPGCRATYFGEA